MISKAIIPVAGWGTRRLPVSKAIEKCMLPIGNRPLVDYVVRDCILGGITDIYFVVSKGSVQLQSYYSTNQNLNTYLQYNGKQDLIPLVTPPTNVNFHYVEQPSDGKYGTAIPAALVYPMLQKGESVIYMTGDAFFHNPSGESEVLRLKAATPEGGSSMLVTEVPRQETSHYGVVQFNEDTGVFERIVEKPQPEQAPSTYINTSDFVLNYDLMGQIYNYAQLDVSGEYQLTESINQYVLSAGVVTVVPAQGVYLDGGNLDGWMRANEVIVRGAK